MTRPVPARPWMLAVTLAVLATHPVRLAAQASSTSTSTPPSSSSTSTTPSTPSTTVGKPAIESKAAATTRPAGEPVAPPGSSASKVAGWTALLVATAILALLAYLTFQLVTRFTRAFDDRLALGMRSHWGGFGGGESGWEVSPALALLLAAVVLTIATVALGGAVVDAAARLLEGTPAASTGAPAPSQPAGGPASSTSAK